MSSVDAKNLQHVGFILIPGFALMSYASATEPLRAANLLAGREIYRIANFSPEGKHAHSSSGVLVPTEPLPGRRSELGTVFVCAGGSPRE